AAAYAAKIPILVGANAYIDQLATDQELALNRAILLIPGRESLVDGYAVRSEDFPGYDWARGESRLFGGAWAIVQLRPYDSSATLERHEAMPIRRGQTMPEGADAAIMHHSMTCIQGKNGMVLDSRLTPRDTKSVYPGQDLVQVAQRYDKIHRV